ncbi:probable carboxylesterase 15 [Oryza brachyantha]|uniref:probable carboxylesterase 15 n=1 Tax=Oryza brachyantha TaxID=4533 RepID=UPI001ADD21F5|nr:probable carboxylesterase 15 [Oryza brachyantha]
MESATPAPYVVEDCGPNLQLFSDGTVVRFDDYNILPPLVLPPELSAVQWKDVVYDAGRGLKLRVYKPPPAAAVAGGKLPVVVYFHGGGYVIGSFEMENFHACCLRLAYELPAVVLSADYRLAPEHRLPAAHDDATTVMSWVRDQAVATGDAADPWLAESADFGLVFVSGDSAGAGIVHHIALRLGSGQVAVDPARVAGCVLLFPFFGGEERTRSEAEYSPGPFLTLPLSDQAWRLALPQGAARDHPLANPFGPESPALDDAVALPPLLVVAAQHDLLRDRDVDYAARLRATGKRVELVEFEGQHHGFFAAEPFGDAGSELVRVVSRFVYGNAAASNY